MNIHPTLMFIAKLAMKHMPDKLRNRVQFYSRIDETKIIEKSEFPVEYDGEVEGSILTGNWKQAGTLKFNFKYEYVFYFLVRPLEEDVGNKTGFLPKIQRNESQSKLLFRSCVELRR